MERICHADSCKCLQGGAVLPGGSFYIRKLKGMMTAGIRTMKMEKQIQPLADRELPGKAGKRFFSDGKAGPSGFRGKIILATLRYFSGKPCLSGSVRRKALVVQRAAKARVFTIKMIKS
jgi:hypothetical protein